MCLCELMHDGEALTGGHRTEQALEPRHGLRRLTTLEVESRECAQRIRRWRQRDNPAVTTDRAVDFFAVDFGDVRIARPQPGSARRLAGALEALGLVLQQIGELTMLALAREQARDRVDRQIVTGSIFEIR